MQYQSLQVKCLLIGVIAISFGLVIGLGVGIYSFRWYDVIINLFVIPIGVIVIAWISLYFGFPKWYKEFMSLYGNTESKDDPNTELNMEAPLYT